jgi:hypothetical protein
MKKLILWSIFFLLGLILSDCKKKEEIPCAPISIESVFPNNNTAGGPVLIKGTGFSSNTVVRFGNVNATISDVNEFYISTKVPPGLQGTVELMVENGSNCTATKPFEIVGSAPGNLPASPSTYVIPPAGFASPIQVTTDETLCLINVYAPTHRVVLFPFRTNYNLIGGQEKIGTTSYPINGTESQGIITLTITQPQNVIETYKMSYYTVTLDINGQRETGNFFIAFSSRTGRQLIFRQRGSGMCF